MHWRTRIAAGQSFVEANDSWVRLSTAQNIFREPPIEGWIKVYTNETDKWSWVTNNVDGVGNPVKQFFNTGDHTLEIAGRSPGHAIDRIAFRKVDTVNFDVTNFEAMQESIAISDISTAPDPLPTPEPSPSVIQDPVGPIVVPWAIYSAIPEGDTCVDSVLALAPLDDVYTKEL